MESSQTSERVREMMMNARKYNESDDEWVGRGKEMGRKKRKREEKRVGEREREYERQRGRREGALFLSVWPVYVLSCCCCPVQKVCLSVCLFVCCSVPAHKMQISVLFVLGWEREGAQYEQRRRQRRMQSKSLFVLVSCWMEHQSAVGHTHSHT